MDLAVVTREEDLGYLAFIGGQMYKINRVGCFGHEVYFDEKDLPDGKMLQVLQDELTAAFVVFGANGIGPDDEELDPIFTVKKGA